MPRPTTSQLLQERLDGFKLYLDERFRGLEQRLDDRTEAFQKSLEAHMVQDNVERQRTAAEIEGHKHRISALERKPGTAALGVLRWVGLTVGGVLLVALLYMATDGALRRLENTPTIGNSPSTQSSKP